MRRFVGAAALSSALFAVMPSAQAQIAGPASCDYREFLGEFAVQANGRYGFNQDTMFARVAQMETPLFREATGDSRLTQLLRFNQRVTVVDPGQNSDRIKIKDADSGQISGWVSRRNLLCRIEPVIDRESRLYRRAVVKTTTARQGETQAKTLVHTLDPRAAQRCEGGPTSCFAVSRFNWYFIYAEEGDHYLISSDSNLGSNRGVGVLGWLRKDDSYVWNTALGLRPIEELAQRRGPNNASEDYVCAFPTSADLAAGSKCSEITGGDRWFGLQVRIAILKEENNVYRVAFANAQSGRIDVSAATAALARLDVFFLIDGTRSMTQPIEGIKQLVDRISSQMAQKISRGGILRFGFRVYRDSVQGGSDGVENSENLPLSPTNCDTANLDAFKRAFGQVKAFDPDGDNDYPENTFGGMIKAADDIAGCPNNAKLLFVIGDHGYDAARQKARGHAWWTEQQVAARFRPGPRYPNGAPLVVFIQTPKLDFNAKADEAYTEFEKQGRDILQRIYADTRQAQSASAAFKKMPPGPISESVIQQTLTDLRDYLQPDALAITREGLAAGESLTQIIDRLRKDSALNIPIRYIQFLEDTLCRQLGPQCREQVFEGVNEAYMKADDPKVIPEVLLTRDQLSQWSRILDVFKTAGRDTRGDRGRGLMVHALMTELGHILRIDIPNNNSLLNTFATHLPASARSKLMQYSDTELRSRIPYCEFEYLASYAGRKYDVLNMILVSEGKLLPIVPESRPPADMTCPLSEKGKTVPVIGVVRPRTITPAGQERINSVMYQRGNDVFFWIPVNYLP